MKQYDAAVVGAGILGLAHAYQLAKRGLKVAVFERHAKAHGASVRNFGMVWPLGQPSGTMYRLARRSREIWLEVLQASGLWHQHAGCLHVAYHADEAAVLDEFTEQFASEGANLELLTASEVSARFPAINPTNLKAGLFSPFEVTVDPRQVVAELPAWLQRQYGVEFHFDTAVRAYGSPTIHTTKGDFGANRLVICTGADFREVCPTAFAESGLFPCKLQMMRSQAFGNRYQIGTMLAAGLTLCHYKSFAKCPTLPALRQRYETELPQYLRLGIHVMASQNGHGEIVLGDSHEYGDEITPFDRPDIDQLVLDYLQQFLVIPQLEITARWNGVYIKHPSAPYIVARPQANTVAVTGVGGAGMTLSFGLAEQTITEELGACS